MLSYNVFGEGIIRGYRVLPIGIEPVATAGKDFSGYGMYTADLRSPFVGELWLLVWGQGHTFNGKRVRFRIYSFDGERFNTVWSPEDMLDAEVTLTDSGFSIAHRLKNELPWRLVRDDYVVTAQGAVKVSP